MDRGGQVEAAGRAAATNNRALPVHQTQVAVVAVVVKFMVGQVQVGRVL